MLLRAVAVCAILAVALAAPDIMQEDEDDEIELSSLASSSSEGDERTAAELGELDALTAQQAQHAEEEADDDKSLFAVESGRSCPGCGKNNGQRTDAATDVTLCVACYKLYSQEVSDEDPEQDA